MGTLSGIMAEAAQREAQEEKPREEEEFSLPPGEASKRDADIERTRQELSRRLDGYVPVRDITNPTTDRLNDRFTIYVNRPLPAFSYGNVRAYEASDSKGGDVPIYAAVCDPARPYRYRALQLLEKNENPHLARLIGHGITHISAVNEHRYVIIFERPQGQCLKDILSEGRAYNERGVLELILKPLASVIAMLEGLGISHGRISPENVFIGEKTMLGECIAEPAIFSRDIFYEPIERLLSSTQGAGGGSSKTDIFDLGVLALDSMQTLKRIRGKFTRDTLAAAVLAIGAFNLMTAQAHFSDNFADFLVGTLNDDYEERWNSAQLNSWLVGKRYNLLRPTHPRDATRPFEFDGEMFFSLRALAHAFFAKWENAKSFVRESKIERWMDQSIHKREMGDLVRRAISTTGGTFSNNPKQNSELLARLISILDPSGPIRLEHLSFSLGGLGLLIADAMRDKKQKELGLIREAIDFDLLNFWAELQTSAASEEASDALWKIQRHRPFLSMRAMGFGMERIMYDLNPHLPCLSQNLLRYHISNLPDMLYALDALARAHGKATNFSDRHLAAFLASHAGVMKDTQMRDLRHRDELLKNPEISVMIILAKAQERAHIKKLKGLSYWAALRIIEMTKHIHGMQTRKNVCRDLLEAGEMGHIGYVIQTLLNVKVLNGDQAGFEKAQATFNSNRKRIARLRDPGRKKEKSQYMGYALASLLSLAMLGYSIFLVARRFF
jgi:serine/threonine protein kinase